MVLITRGPNSARNIPGMSDKDVRRFWGRVSFPNTETGCMVWSGYLSGGYGRLVIAGDTYYAHRVSFYLAAGNAPIGTVLDHLCRNRACVNPTHLEAVSCRENLLRGEGVAAQNTAVTHCPMGHEFSDENTYVRRNGSRSCRTCRILQGRVYDRTRRKCATKPC